MIAKSSRYFLVLVFAFGFSANLFAHTKLASSIPAADQVLSAAPEQLQLVFGADVRLMLLIVKQQDGAPIDFQFAASTTVGKTFTYPLPPIAAGTYSVEWAILGGDGHRMQGDFHFSVSDTNKPNE